jgi:hypothetical protein
MSLDREPGSGFIIGIRWILLRIGSLCKELHSHHQDRSPDLDSSDDYPEIGANACGEPTESGRLYLHGDLEW